MRNLSVCCLVLVIAGASAPATAGECSYPASGQLQAGRDASGYFVRATPTNGDTLAQGASIGWLGDFLASEGHATVIYYTFLTRKALSRGEWRGPDPLEVFRVFGAVAGLQIENPSPGLWVVTCEDLTELSATSIFVRPLDPTQQILEELHEDDELERALINQLPVRQACGRLQRCAIGVGYYRLADEGRETLLVRPSTAGQAAGRWDLDPVFKVAIDREGGVVRVSCIWAGRAHGVLVPEVSEDFDGDGYRDFVFFGGFTDGLANDIVSGRDGHILVRFSGQDLLVQKGVEGPLRIAVAHVVGSPEELGFSDSEARPRVLALDRDRLVYRVDAKNQARETATREHSSGLTDRDDLRRRFASHVGGLDRARAYVFGEPAQTARTVVEEVRLPMPKPVSVSRKAIEGGLSARLLFEYKSVSVLAAEKRRADAGVAP